MNSKFGDGKKTWLNVQRYIWVCVRYYTKNKETGKDISQNVITSFLEKNIDLSKLTKRYIYNAVRFATYRFYHEFRDYKNLDGDTYVFVRDYEFIQQPEYPEEEKEYQDYLLRGIRPKGNMKLHDKVLNLLMDGKTLFEISLMLEKKYEQVAAICAYAIKKLKMTHNNPISGSKLKITRQLSLGSWEKKIDKDDYEYEDGNEFYELYQHKESKEGILVKLPAEKTNPYIK